jgi:hypothetical protein
MTGAKRRHAIRDPDLEAAMVSEPCDMELKVFVEPQEPLLTLKMA